jgi:ABC-2 type transport system ATP-binding protein
VALIEIDRLTHDYPLAGRPVRSRRALDQLTLSVESGETLALLGPNGAGKTTLFRILAGLLRPTVGRVVLGIDGYAPDRVDWKRSLGYLPEQPVVDPSLTPEECLLDAARLSGLDPAEARSCVADVLARVGLTATARQRLRGFSKGMRQRVALAQAILHQPTLLLLDEPMSGLDPLGRRLVRDLLTEARAARRTVLFSTHTLSDAERFADRIAILHQGRLIALGPLSTILGPPTTAEVEVAAAGLAAVDGFGGAVGILDLRVDAAGDLHARLASEQALPAFLELLWRQGGRLLSVKAARPTLEEWFDQHLRPDAP